MLHDKDFVNSEVQSLIFGLKMFYLVNCVSVQLSNCHKI